MSPVTVAPDDVEADIFDLDFQATAGDEPASAHMPTIPTATQYTTCCGRFGRPPGTTWGP